jgi:hypothetical protein
MKSGSNAQADRRALLAGAGAVGALAGVAALLPSPPPVAGAVADATPASPAAAQGYQVTEHVLRYYQTARV